MLMLLLDLKLTVPTVTLETTSLVHVQSLKNFLNLTLRNG